MSAGIRFLSSVAVTSLGWLIYVASATAANLPASRGCAGLSSDHAKPFLRCVGSA